MGFHRFQEAVENAADINNSSTISLFSNCVPLRCLMRDKTFLYIRIENDTALIRQGKRCAWFLASIMRATSVHEKREILKASLKRSPVSLPWIESAQSIFQTRVS